MQNQTHHLWKKTTTRDKLKEEEAAERNLVAVVIHRKRMLVGVEREVVSWDGHRHEDNPLDRSHHSHQCRKWVGRK